MRIPATMSILGRTFEVKQEVVPSENENQFIEGLCDHIDQYIMVNPTMHMEEKFSTLLHEWLEAVNSIMVLDLPHHTIDLLEIALYDLLKSNKL